MKRSFEQPISEVRGNALVDQRLIDTVFEEACIDNRHETGMDSERFYQELREALLARTGYDCFDYDRLRHEAYMSHPDMAPGQELVLTILERMDIADRSRGSFEITFELATATGRVPAALIEAFSPVRFQASVQALAFIERKEARQRAETARDRLKWALFLEFAQTHAGQLLPASTWNAHRDFLDVLPCLEPEADETWQLMPRLDRSSGKRFWEVIIYEPHSRDVRDVYQLSDLY